MKSTDNVLAKMAYSRQQFKDRVEEKVGGSLLEFYKAECATANGYTRWVEHWRTEVARLLAELQVVLLHEIRGFKDRRKAFAEVMSYMEGKDATYRRIAENAVTRDFQVKRLRQPTPPASRATFHEMIWKAAEEALIVD
ncbi:MAG: hypothetical protein JNM56_22860 [Planctomycetia bacterium]|nr:hypothetical protein [Planctomycetia bacterium]